MKLSWHEAHLRFTPRKTCPMLCAACIGGTWLALTAPRQMMPLMKPSDSGVGSTARHELVVRHVAEQRGVQPCADLLAPAVDVAGALVVVAQQVVPEAQPVLGVAGVVGEQFRDEMPAFVGTRVGEKLIQLLRRRQQPNHVEIHAARERPVIDRAWPPGGCAWQSTARATGRWDWRPARWPAAIRPGAGAG